MTGEYILEPTPRSSVGGARICHLEGVPWFEAPVPRRFHRCWVQTRGWVGMGLVERCACGGLRQPSWGRGWIERNSRDRKTAATHSGTSYIERTQIDADSWDAMMDSFGTTKKEASDGT